MDRTSIIVGSEAEPSGMDKLGIHHRMAGAGVLGLVVLGLLTRLFGIWEGSILGDEFYTVAYAAERARSLIQPAYYVLVVWSTTLFGDVAWAARLPAALLGAAGIPLFYWGFSDIIGRKAALIGAILVLFSGWHLYHSQIARFYSGVFLFALLSYVSFYHALKRDDLRWLLGALLANVLVVLFHATAVLVPVACFVFAVIVGWWKPGRFSGLSVRVARWYSLVLGAVGLLAMPLFFMIAHRWMDHARPRFQVEEVVSVLLQLVQHVEPIVGIASLLGLIFLLRRDRFKGLFFLTGLLVPILGLVVFALVLPPVRAKYIIGTLPLFMALAALLAAKMQEILQRHGWGLASWGATALLAIGLLPGFVSHYTGKYSLDLEDALAALEAGYQPGDRIVAFSHSVGYHLEKRYPPEVLQVLGGKGVWKQALKPYEAGAPRVWVLVDTYRNQRFDTDLFAWLMEHAALKWRKYEWRLDYQQMGFELYRIG